MTGLVAGLGLTRGPATSSKSTRSLWTCCSRSSRSAQAHDALRRDHPRPGADRRALRRVAWPARSRLVAVPYPGLVVKRSIPQSGRTGAVIERATTKSGRSRLVPLTDLVRPVVQSWAEGREPDDLLFPAPEGGYLSAQNWRRAVHWTTTDSGAGPMTSATRPPASGSRWRRHQDCVLVARSLDGETDPRHLWPPHGHGRRPGGSGASESRFGARRGYGSEPWTGRGREGQHRRWGLTCANSVVPPARFELATPALGERCSIP